MRVELDRPIVAGIIALAAALLLVVLRLVLTTHGDVTAFILVGTKHMAGAGLPPGIHVLHGSGYDGEFYFRQALNPFDTATTAHGIRLDDEFRLQRIGYPLIAWLLSGGGNAGALPIVLVAINVVGLGVIGWLGGMFAVNAGRHALAGLLLPGYFGFTMTVARDLAEVVEVAFLLGAVLVWRRGRWGWAGFLFACAVVTRETELAVVFGYAAALAIAWVSRRARRRELAPWFGVAAPVLAFVIVQGWLVVATGHWAFRSDQQGNLATPFVAPLDAVRHYVAHANAFANLLWLGELAVLGAVVLAAFFTLTKTSAGLEEKLGFILLVGLALCLSSRIWNGQADFRSLAPLYALASVVLLGSKRRLGFFYLVCGLAFLVGFVHRALYL